MIQIKIDKNTLPLDGQKIRFITDRQEEFTGTFSEGDDLFLVNSKKWFPSWSIDSWEPIED